MNPLREWGLIKFKPLTNPPTKPLEKENDYYIPIHLSKKIREIETIQAVYNKYFTPNILDLRIMEKTIEIEPPSSHPVKELNILLPTIHAILLHITPKEYIKLTNLTQKDLPIIITMYNYLQATPYYHTPLQSNHKHSFKPPLPERLFTLMKYFDPKTLKLLAIIIHDKHPLIIPIMLPKQELVKNIIPEQTFKEYNKQPPVITLQHLEQVLKTTLKHLRIPTGALASKYLSLSMWGADATFQATKTSISTIIQLNLPRTTTFKTIPYKSLIHTTRPPNRSPKGYYKQVTLLHYDPNTNTLYFKHKNKPYQTTLLDRTLIKQNIMIIPFKGEPLTLELEENYYNELMVQFLHKPRIIRGIIKG